MQRNEKLWILLSAPGIGLIYVTSSAAASVDEDHNWNQATGDVGDDKSRGDNFEVLVVAADANASALLSRTANGPAEEPSVKALPGGSYVIASQCVTRA
jgi:hypothetical protein